MLSLILLTGLSPAAACHRGGQWPLGLQAESLQGHTGDPAHPPLKDSPWRVSVDGKGLEAGFTLTLSGLRKSFLFSWPRFVNANNLRCFSPVAQTGDPQPGGGRPGPRRPRGGRCLPRSAVPGTAALGVIPAGSVPTGRTSRRAQPSPLLMIRNTSLPNVSNLPPDHFSRFEFPNVFKTFAWC